MHVRACVFPSRMVLSERIVLAHVFSDTFSLSKVLRRVLEAVPCQSGYLVGEQSRLAAIDALLVLHQYRISCFKSAYTFTTNFSMTNKSSKGKGKATESDMPPAQSPSFHDNNDFAVPRSTGDFAQASYPLVEQPYAYSDNYFHRASGAAQDPCSNDSYYSPGMASGIAGGGSYPYDAGSGAPANSVTSNDWDAMSTGTSTTTPASVWSSSTMSSSGASSAPSQGSNVNTHINRQPPPRQRYELPCELRSIGCHQVFRGDEEREWREHVGNHLQGSFPSKLKCCERISSFPTPWRPASKGRTTDPGLLSPTSGFCNDFRDFDARDHGGDRGFNFQLRMQHIRNHIVEGDRVEHAEPDGFLVNHLKRQGMIDDRQYQTLLQPIRPPPTAGPSDSQHRHRHRGHHAELQPLWEDAGPSSSSGSRDRRSEKKSAAHHRKRSTK